MTEQRSSELPKAPLPEAVVRLFRRRLWSAPNRSIAEAVKFQRRAYERAVLLVRVFYVASLYWAVSSISSWPTYLHAKSADPLWPVHWWFTHVSLQTGVNIVFCAYLASALVVVLLAEKRWARIVYAIALLQYMAFINTPDKVNHGLHSWLFVSFVFILLPRGPWGERRRASDRQLFLVVFWIAILIVLFFYSLTGLWKIHDALVALAQGRINGFNVSAFSYIVGSRLLQTNQVTLLGNFFTRNALPGWFLFTGTMYVETVSVLIAFRPRLHQVWGIVLILFHVGTQVAMGFTFEQNIVLVGLLLVCSPFAIDAAKPKAMVLDLPVLHFASVRWRALRASHASGDGPSNEVDHVPQASEHQEVLK